MRHSNQRGHLKGAHVHGEYNNITKLWVLQGQTLLIEGLKGHLDIKDHHLFSPSFQRFLSPSAANTEYPRSIFNPNITEAIRLETWMRGHQVAACVIVSSSGSNQDCPIYTNNQFPISHILAILVVK